ncbi:TetR/AcrR family transcriptional regulator [Nesterenkonia muleiensis]|uniref:TetR/AcrR family transcriptional regulator n=1 Tax=Nesterenkonia muleiensis TaxID=2282648 RepID=UPI000E75DAF1|nr:TetR/AcrR family transcriptional regulator [Nesterenkonia muleiensis]
MSSSTVDYTGQRPRTRRQAEKEQRYRNLLEAAGRLFGTHGYASVTLDDIGSSVGVSGQAIYRHFKGKQDLLGHLLVEVSAGLLEGAQQIQAEEADIEQRIDRLVAFHVDFALSSPEIIRVQEQEMLQLLEADQRRVRRMQREYIRIWTQVLGTIHPQASRIQLRTRIHGIFGLINSTAHSLKHSYGDPPSPEEAAEISFTLTSMARATIECTAL